MQPINRLTESEDPEGAAFLEQKFRFDRNHRVRMDAKDEQLKAGMFSIVCNLVLVLIQQSTFEVMF